MCSTAVPQPLHISTLDNEFSIIQTKITGRRKLITPLNMAKQRNFRQRMSAAEIKKKLETDEDEEDVDELEKR